MDNLILDKEELEISDINSLQNFNEKVPTFKTHVEFNLTESQFETLWNLLHKLLANQHLSLNCSQLLTCLGNIRILSRDRLAIEKIVVRCQVEMLLSLANIDSSPERLYSRSLTQDEMYKVQDEASKCLSNLLFQSPFSQSICCTCHNAKEVLMLLRNDSNLPQCLQIAYLKLVFLVTAFNTSARSYAVEEADGLSVLLTLLRTEREKSKGKHKGPTMQKELVELTVEVLKLLYTLCVGVTGDSGMCGAKPGEGCGARDSKECGLKPEDKQDLTAVVGTARELLLSTAHTHEHTQLMHTHCINVLVSVPSCVMHALTPPCQESRGSWWMGTASTRRQTSYKGQDMSAICQVLAFLHARLNAPDQQTSDNLSPVLTMLISCCESNMVLRRFVRMRVMPPLRDVMNRPEEGSTIRNRLVRLMTSPVLKLKHLSATFLFVLSNHSVDRLIKYSGYGNCAGLLAALGLLSNRRNNPRDNTTDSDSEDSETEEYERVKHMVNPVTGCYEPVKPNPLDEMTEEQKEYETNKLVNALDKLIRDGAIKPCGVGPDGKPQPVEHVLQLQDPKFNPHVPANLNDATDEESD